MGESNTGDIDMAAADKVEPAAPDGTPSSLESTPDPDPDAAAAEPSQETAQPQKRKGGRKPIYATSEERKQRNRQAQAAFRERRTEYIKHLEANIKQHEETLVTLQQSHRTAADECLMLRYKNSLLERILLEKGIDVQAELQMKTGSPVLGPGFMHTAGGLPQQPQLQRTALQRQQARRSAQNFLPKLAPGQNADMGFSTASPHAHPTPSSHASSPSQLSTRSPLNMHQGGMTPPISAVVAQPQTQQFNNFARSSQQYPNQAVFQVQQQSNSAQRPPQRPTTSSNYQSSASGLSSFSAGSQSIMGQSADPGSAASGGPQSASSFYPSPFQKHFEQLDREYDADHSRSMLDSLDTDDVVKSPQLQGSYPSQLDDMQPQRHDDFYQQPQGMHQGRQQQQPGQAQFEPGQMIPPTSHPSAADGQFDTTLLDADPFGLSASMHYPTNYSFEQQQQQMQRQ